MSLPRTKVELLERLLASTEFYDCTFNVGAGTSNKEFKAIKAHLANISEVFRAQLFGKFAEASQNRDTPINLPNVDPEIFECILRESYGLDPRINENNVLRLIDESKYYSIPLLANDCIMWLKDHLDGSNVLQVLNNAYLSGLVKFKVFNQELADWEKEDEKKSEETTTAGGDDAKDDEKDESKDDAKDDSKDEEKGGSGGLDDEKESKDPSALSFSEGIDSDVLSLRCLNIIAENSKEVVESEYFWKSLHINVIIFIICNDYFCVSEDLLWTALVKWAKYQQEQINAANTANADAAAAAAANTATPAADTTATTSGTGTEENKTELPADGAASGGGDKFSQLGVAPGLDLSGDIALQWCRENNVNLDEFNRPQATPATATTTTEEKSGDAAAGDAAATTTNTDAAATTADANAPTPYYLLQPLLQYVRFANMSHKYFCSNVTEWLSRKDLEYVVTRMLCPELKSETDEKREESNLWKLTDDERKDLVRLRRDAFEKLTPETKEFASNGRKYEVVKASTELDKAKLLPREGTDAEWSRHNLSSQPTQYFVVKLNLELSQLRFLSNELRIEWKNHYSDSDTIRNVQIFASNRVNVLDADEINGDNADEWSEITTWSGNQTTDRQNFTINVETLRSPFIKFHVVDTFGGYTCLDDMRIYGTVTE